MKPTTIPLLQALADPALLDRAIRIPVDPKTLVFNGPRRSGMSNWLLILDEARFWADIEESKR